MHVHTMSPISKQESSQADNSTVIISKSIYSLNSRANIYQKRESWIHKYRNSLVYTYIPLIGMVLQQKQTRFKKNMKIHVAKSWIREQPFNLKGGGGLCFFWEKKNSVGKFDWKKNSVSEMGRKNILLALCALKMIVFIEKK